MLHDENVFLIGESIGKKQGGAFFVTKGLEEEFDKTRVVETAISENIIAGVAVGAAAFGMRPVAEIMFGSLMTLVVDEIHNQAGTLFYLSGGKIKCPMVIRTCNWMRIISGPHHCGNVDAIWLNSPGIKAVAPSSAYDVKGLIKAAIRDDDPVVFIEYSPFAPNGRTLTRPGRSCEDDGKIIWSWDGTDDNGNYEKSSLTSGSFDEETGMLRAISYFEQRLVNGKVIKEEKERAKHYATLSQIHEWLFAAGFVIEFEYENFDKKPLDDDSCKVIIYARKRETSNN